MLGADACAARLCFIRAGSHRDVVLANLRTALNQEQPNPLSEVEGIAHAHHEVGLSLEEIMDASGKAQGWVEDRLIIYEASPAVKENLGDGTIRFGHAAVLARIEVWEDQENMLHQLQTYGWTVKELEDQIRGANLPEQPQDEGQHDVSFTAHNESSRERKPQTCKGCGTGLELQIAPVCEGCLNALSLGEGKMGVLVALLRRAEEALAGSAETVPLAEEIGAVLDDA